MATAGELSLLSVARSALARFAGRNVAVAPIYAFASTKESRGSVTAGG